MMPRSYPIEAEKSREVGRLEIVDDLMSKLKQ